MAYTDHFRLVDDVTSHFDGTVAAVDAFLQSRYVGFYSITSAAVIELALKEIIITFASRNNQLFGGYVEAKYEQINGRIGLKSIMGEHLGPFGTKYQKRFQRLLNRVDNIELRRRRFAIKASYGNLLACRHRFAHEGSIPSSSSYTDVKRGFDAGKIVLACLAKTLSLP
jgi:RiboL-PSP-HEPN